MNRPPEKTSTSYTDVGTDYVLVQKVSYDGQFVGYPKSVSRAMCATRLMSGSETLRSHFIAGPDVIKAIRAMWDGRESPEQRTTVGVWLRHAESYYDDRFRS